MVHVVRDSAVRVAQKTHAPLTVKVDRGALWSIEMADHAASICKDAGKGVWPNCFAKVRVAGSSPVVRSQRTRRSSAVVAVEIGLCSRSLIPDVPHPYHSRFVRPCANDHLLRVKVSHGQRCSQR